MSLKWRMSESHTVADKSFELSVPAAASNSSILRRTSSVCWRISASRRVGYLPGEVDGRPVSHGLAHPGSTLCRSIVISDLFSLRSLAACSLNALGQII
jgi:hypothetical protein